MNILSRILIGSMMTLPMLASPAQMSVADAKPPACISESCISIKVLQYAEKYQISENEMWRIIKCENPGLNPSQQSLYHYTIDHPDWGVKKGEQELSFGLVQIHLPGHLDITKEQATDVDFSLEFLAKNLSEGKGKMWTCY